MYVGRLRRILAVSVTRGPRSPLGSAVRSMPLLWSAWTWARVTAGHVDDGAVTDMCWIADLFGAASWASILITARPACTRHHLEHNFQLMPMTESLLLGTVGFLRRG